MAVRQGKQRHFKKIGMSIDIAVRCSNWHVEQAFWHVDII
jgi:hypothetical protein